MNQKENSSLPDNMLRNSSGEFDSSIISPLAYLIIFILIVNSIALFFPILRNDDSVLYANIAKHMALSNDWASLISANQPWLDKPHFPFWITAFSFKIFGINSFGYILPGFIFHLLGALYTYKLAKYLYKSHDIALISSIIYLSAIHLLLSNSLDLRAEAYLLGEIIPAAYYWLRYSNIFADNNSSWKYLFLGALFSALAMMTKGLFTIITLSSGVITLLIFNHKFKELFSKKWLYAVALSFFLILPELITLYLQFDLHPSLVIFNQTHVSGIKWFFWGSQFGRFLGNGQIVVNHAEPFHYFFFIHTFLWAFLPWSIIFLYALYNLRRIKSFDQCQKNSAIYLLGSFLPTFIIFSVTSFQLDHYTNILMPFAAILAAEAFYTLGYKNKALRVAQFILALMLLILACILGILILPYYYLYVSLICGILVVWYRLRNSHHITQIIVFSGTAISAVFLLVTLVLGGIDQKYDVGYNIASKLNNINALNIKKIPVVTYKMDSVTLRFYYHEKYLHIEDLNQLNSITKPYYLVVETKSQTEITKLPNMHYINTVKGNTIDAILRHILNKNAINKNLVSYDIFEIN